MGSTAAVAGALGMAATCGRNDIFGPTSSNAVAVSCDAADGVRTISAVGLAQAVTSTMSGRDGAARRLIKLNCGVELPGTRVAARPAQKPLAARWEVAYQ